MFSTISIPDQIFVHVLTSNHGLEVNDIYFMIIISDKDSLGLRAFQKFKCIKSMNLIYVKPTYEFASGNHKLESLYMKHCTLLDCGLAISKFTSLKRLYLSLDFVSSELSHLPLNLERLIIHRAIKHERFHPTFKIDAKICKILRYM